MCQLKKHAYAGLPPSENHASQGKNVRTNTRNSAFPRALGWHKSGSVLSFNGSHLKAVRCTYLIGQLMSKRGMCHFTQPYYIGS